MFRVTDINTSERKFVGRSKAVVLDNKDPDKRGRIIVDHPLLGSTVWIDYLNVPGMFSAPEIGDLVYVECDCGYASHPIAWGSVAVGDDTTNIPDIFQRTVPTNRGLYSPKGHSIELDDGLPIVGTGSGIRITTAGGTSLTIDNQKDAILAQTVFGDNYELSAINGFQVDTPVAGGTHLSQKSGKFDIFGAVQVSASDGIGATLKLTGGTVALGNGGIEVLDLLDRTLEQLGNILTAIEALTVPTAVGPSGVPINSAAFVTAGTAISSIKLQLNAIKGTL
jgi:hypothetical protein